MEHYAEFAATIQQDLETGFARLREEYYAQYQAEFDSETVNEHLKSLQQYDDFIQSKFTELALAGLVVHGHPSNAVLARPYLSHKDHFLRDAAAELICKVGSSEDVDALLKLLAEAWGDIRQRAAEAALRLATSPQDVAFELIRNKSSEVQKVAFEWLYSQNTDDARNIFRSLLDDDSEINRTRAIYYFSRWLDHEGLETLLKEYVSRETYYYSVVTWLDRLLYSVRPLREAFFKDLRRQASLESGD